MGHVQSKRKRERKRRKISQLSEIMKTMTTINADMENIHKVADHRIYRDSFTTDQLSNSSGYFSSNEPSPHSPGNDGIGWSLGSEDLFEVPEDKCSNLGMSAIEELYTYKGIPIDDHPALTNLQNEQNTRLENMEQRISRIRTSAQKAYDRKKFAHIFRAKREESRTETLLQDASDLLEHNVDARNSGHDVWNNNDYSGEIIPVHYLEEKDRIEGDTDDEDYIDLSSFGSLKFSEPVMILILPFLLPLFIIVAVIRGLSETFGWKEAHWKSKSRRNS